MFISSGEMCYMTTAPSLGFLGQTAADPQPTAEATITTSALRGLAHVPAHLYGWENSREQP